MSDKMREEFEAWHRSVVEGEPPHEKYNSGDYWNQHVQRYWLGWQASRSAVVIELPQIVGFEGAYDSQQDHELVPRMSDVEDADEIFGLVRSIEVREALEAVGVKCK